MAIDRLGLRNIRLGIDFLELELRAQLLLFHLAIDNGQFVSPAGDVTGYLKQARKCFGVASFANFCRVGLGSD